MYQAVIIQTLWLRNIPVYMSLCSFSFIAQVCMLPVADTTRYSKCTKNPHENFLSRVLLSVQQTKKAYPLHLMAKKIQRETSYDLLSFLVQKTVYFF